MPYDHIADADVLNALDPAHPVTPPCTTVNAIVGGYEGLDLGAVAVRCYGCVRLAPRRATV